MYLSRLGVDMPPQDFQSLGHLRHWAYGQLDRAAYLDSLCPSSEMSRKYLTVSTARAFLTVGIYSSKNRRMEKQIRRDWRLL